MENTLVKFSSVRIVASYFATSFKLRFLEAPEKGVKLDTKTAKQFAELQFNITELPNRIFADCESARHGLKQKLVDSVAMNKELKAATSLQEVIDSLNSLWSQLKEGNWNAITRGPKAESMKLSDLEQQFLAGVTAGITTYEQAAALYTSITKGKILPPLPTVTTEPEEEEVTEEETEA